MTSSCKGYILLLNAAMELNILTFFHEYGIAIQGQWLFFHTEVV